MFCNNARGQKSKKINDTTHDTRHDTNKKNKNK